MQKAFFIHSVISVRELNQQLEKGAKVIHTCSMPSATTRENDCYDPQCLVVVEYPNGLSV